MNKTLLLIAIIALLSACTVTTVPGGRHVTGEGAMVSQTFETEAFSAIDIRGNYVVTYRQSSESFLRVEMQQNLIDYLQVEVRGHFLHVHSDVNFNTATGYTPRLYIYTSNLDRANFSGAIDARNWDTIYGNNFDINVSGGGNIAIEMEVEQFELSMSGGANVELSGSATRADISGSGGINLTADSLQTRDTTISVSGAANAVIAVSDSLDASISGAGVIQYVGDPDVTSSVSGIGSVRRRN